MSWASRRRTTYLGGVFLAVALAVGIPAVRYFLSIKPTCFDGVQNEGETAIDEGGPCAKLNPADLSPSATMWSRSFKVRDGSYTAVAYLINPNAAAGVAQVHYKFGLYDSNNVVIAERTGTLYLMPGGITPVLEAGLDTGNRVAVHTYFEITDQSLDWEKMTNPASAITVSNQQVTDADSAPHITARVINNSFASLYNVHFVAVVFDPYGNAIAASGTELDELDPGAPQQVTFSWPEAFGGQVGRIDILPEMPPVQAPSS